MRLYTCDNCHNLLYFENDTCLKCGHTVGFDPGKLDLISITTSDNIEYIDVTDSSARYRHCDNRSHGVCNWLIGINDHSSYCIACQLNRTIPFLTPENRIRWKRIEVAKHRLVYSLLRLNLPLYPKLHEDDNGLIFDFMADVSPGERVITGHANGVITLNIEEADEAERARNKNDLGEKYRTLLGHFRHETGHYFWDLFVKGSRVDEFRSIFGDERIDMQTR